MSTALVLSIFLASLIALIPLLLWTSRSDVEVLKNKLRDEYTSPKTRSFRPLPRSSVELKVEDIYVELLLTDKDEALPFYKNSTDHRELFLPPDAGSPQAWRTGYSETPLDQGITVAVVTISLHKDKAKPTKFERKNR